MNNRVSVQQSRRLVRWVTLGVMTLLAAGNPWFTVIAYACQSQVGGC